MTNAPAVTFVYADWVAQYPQFAAVSEPLATGYFARAGLICQNSACNPANRAGILTTVLYLLTAHIAWLNAPRDPSGNPSSTGQNPPPIVGRVSSASEGSVSVSTEWNGSGSPSQAWFLQTPWGAEYWQAMAPFRTARYLANPTFVPSSIYPYRGGFGRGCR